MPPASISSTWLTVIRMPRIVGSPPQTSGLIVIRSICMRLFYKNLRRTQSDIETSPRSRKMSILRTLLANAMSGANLHALGYPPPACVFHQEMHVVGRHHIV